MMGSPLESMVSLGVLVSIAFALGVVANHTSTFLSEFYEVPRTRQHRSIIRAASLSEYLSQIVLLAILSYSWIKNPDQVFYMVGTVMLGSVLLIRPIIQLNTTSLKRCLVKLRMNHKLGNLPVFAWAAASIALYETAHTDVMQWTGLATSIYLLFLAVSVRSALADEGLDMAALVSLRTEDGRDYSSMPLVGETAEFFVLGIRRGTNLLVPKSSVKEAEVCLVRPSAYRSESEWREKSAR
jgi:hypothetical protein